MPISTRLLMSLDARSHAFATTSQKSATPVKKALRYAEQDPVKVEAYLEAISGVNKNDLVYIDETGLDKFLYREKCYAPVGQTVIGHVPGRKFARKSVVSGLQNGKAVSPLMYDGTMNSNLFEAWFEQCLVPETDENAVFIMDNASFHRKSRLQEICSRHNRRIVFLPPYSPELNPIEKTWAWLKKFLRGIANQFATIEEAICYAFKSI